jgi:hypothetical protein
MDSALRHGVVEQILVSFDARHRAGHYDRASRLQVRDRRLHRVKVAVEVGLYSAVEMLFVELFQPSDVGFSDAADLLPDCSLAAGGLFGFLAKAAACGIWS